MSSHKVIVAPRICRREVPQTGVDTVLGMNRTVLEVRDVTMDGDGSVLMVGPVISELHPLVCDAVLAMEADEGREVLDLDALVEEWDGVQR